MFAEIEAWVGSWRQLFNRSEWIIRQLRLPVSKGTEEEPGLLLIQVDGLSRRQLEKAIHEGRLPFLKSLCRREEHELLTFYSGLPSTTPAVQAELYFGVRGGVPAFSFRDPDSGEITSLFNPELARQLERQFARHGQGLLTGGSSWSNIFSGGAASGETHFCISRMGIGDIWRRSHLLTLFTVLILHPISVLRVIALVLLEFAIGLTDALAGMCRGYSPLPEMATVLSRMCAGIALREVITVGGKVDLARGLPVIHLNFVGYDEMAHRRGPAGRFSHWSLLGIDRSIRDLHRAAHASRRRDYHVWIFSDHGQEAARPFEQKVPGGLHRLLRECLERETPPANRTEAPPSASPAHPHGFILSDLGPIAHVYFDVPPGDAEKQLLSRRLVERGVPGVLLRCGDGRIFWHHSAGASEVKAGIDLPPIHPHPDWLKNELIEDLQRWCAHPAAGHLLLVGWSATGPGWTFFPENGSHGGPGPDETQGFLLIPPATPLPEGTETFLRPSHLRTAARALLGRLPAGATPRTAAIPDEFQILSYNVHGCRGTDGRTSPRRIARILRQSAADLIALQELDRHRTRSRAEDQIQCIAEALGFHHFFCPTVIRGSEQYGHAIFSRYPLEKIKAAPLPLPGRTWWPENRAALWCCLHLHGRRLHLVTTHLGLSAAERRLQVAALLGPGWLGGIPKSEPVLLCGDLNFSPGSPPYREILNAGYRDAAPPALATFSSFHPLTRLDHLFFSAGLESREARVIRTDLTRVSSDHLPITARLRFQPSGHT